MAHAPPRLARVHVLTLSDTRTEADDESGRLCQELVLAAGHRIVGASILPDEPALLGARLAGLADSGQVDVILCNGGTGMSARDTTAEAVAAALEKRLDGFGELFRALSFAEVGPRAMFSRALAGSRGRTLIFAMPGSPRAVRLAMERLILPELGHLVAEMHK